MIVKWFNGRNWVLIDGIDGCEIVKTPKNPNMPVSNPPQISEMITTLIITKNRTVFDEIEIQGEAYLLNDEGKTIERIY